MRSFRFTFLLTVVMLIGGAVDTLAQGRIFEDGIYQIHSHQVPRLSINLGGCEEDPATVERDELGGFVRLKWMGNNYRISSIDGEKRLDCPFFRQDNGTPLWTVSDNGLDAQRFVITNEGRGFAIRAAINTNKVVDLPNNRVTGGTQLQLWDYNGGDWQLWRFQKMSSYGKNRCKHCRGNGIVKCPECKGAGRTYNDYAGSYTCTRCGGDDSKDGVEGFGWIACPHCVKYYDY